MEFKIRCASLLDDETKPHDTAYRKGDDWFVHISSLDELMKLAEPVDLILSNNTRYGVLGMDTAPDIIIYDDYVE